MGIFQQFPYSNFHEMNLDQLIKLMRQVQDEWEATKTEWQSYKDYIDNYFSNLDLDEETEKALRRLLNDGTLDAKIDPLIATAVTEWLDANITPTTPIVDDTLSVSGAAADALVAGEKIRALENEAQTGLLKLTALWESGGIDGTTGETTTTNTQIRTTDFIYVGKGTLIAEKAIAPYGARMFFYDYVGGQYQFVSRTTQIFGGEYLRVATGDYVKMAIFNSSYSAITVAESRFLTWNILAGFNNEAAIFTNPSQSKYAHYDSVSKTLTMPDYAIMLYGAERYNIASKVFDLSGISGGYGLIYYNPKLDDIKILDAGSSPAISRTIPDLEYLYIGYIWNEFISFNIYPCYVVNGIMSSKDDSEYIKFKQQTTVEKMAVMGDSMSTFVGYNETQAEGYYSDGTYPTGDVTTVDKTWWYQVAKGLRFGGDDPASAVSLSAVSRSSFKEQSDPTIVPAYDTRRIDRLDINGYPSLVYIFMGTNDCFSPVSSIGTAPNTIGPATLATLPKNILYNTVYLTVRRIQDAYAAANIIGIIPKYCNLATAGFDYEQYRENMDAIKQAYIDLAVPVIDLRECGINQSNVGGYTIDGIHPNATGMTRIARFIVEKTMELGVCNSTNY